VAEFLGLAGRKFKVRANNLGDLLRYSAKIFSRQIVIEYTNYT
jgi:hypothetical protein